MGTKDVRVTLTEERHERLKSAKGEATWREALEAGCEVVGDE